MAGTHSITTRIFAIGRKPDDDRDTALQKLLLVLSTLMMAAMAVIWGGIYWLFDARMAAAIPLSYAAVSFISIALFAAIKRYRFFRTSQLAFSLFLPFLLMITLGGYVNSSGVVLWSITSPLGALLFAGKRQATWWFLAFLALVVAGVGFDVALQTPATTLPPFMILFFFVMNIGVCSTVVFVLTVHFVSGKAAALDQIEIERAKSTNLLANILPETIARRLMDQDRPIADRLDDVTILFADIVGFAEFASTRSADNVVTVLDDVFSAFDDLADKHGLEKIKTIGDAYMVAGGLPEPNPDHATAVADFALDALAVLDQKRQDTAFDLSVRMGMHSGSVVAGVIGKRKFSYDIWGNTVNLAVRLEAAGSPGRVLVSKATRDLLHGTHRLDAQGVVAIKGLGRQETFTLQARR